MLEWGETEQQNISNVVNFSQHFLVSFLLLESSVFSWIFTVYSYDKLSATRNGWEQCWATTKKKFKWQFGDLSSLVNVWSFFISLFLSSSSMKICTKKAFCDRIGGGTKEKIYQKLNCLSFRCWFWNNRKIFHRDFESFAHFTRVQTFSI